MLGKLVSIRTTEQQENKRMIRIKDLKSFTQSDNVQKSCNSIRIFRDNYFFDIFYRYLLCFSSNSHATVHKLGIILNRCFSFSQNNSITFLHTRCDVLSVVQWIRTGGDEPFLLLQRCAFLLLGVTELTEMELLVLALGNLLHRLVRAPASTSGGGQEGPLRHSIGQHKKGQQPDQKQQQNVEKQSHLIKWRVEVYKGKEDPQERRKTWAWKGTKERVGGERQKECRGKRVYNCM